MATNTVSAVDTAYTLVSSASDFLVQNVGPTPVVVRFDTVLPAVSERGHTLFSGAAIEKSSGIPSGSLYVKAEADTGTVVVSE